MKKIRKYIKIKVCGMRDSQNIANVLELGIADFLGFIFFRQSKRFIGNSDISKTPDNIKRVGVFVKENFENVLSNCKKYNLDFAQLHGDESPDYCRMIRSNNIGVIKVIRVSGKSDLQDLDLYAEVADYLLFDTRSDEYGGTGKSFDWDLLKEIDSPLPFFVSGGLNVDNIRKAMEIENVNFYGLDINSGFEIDPGLKDVEKLKYLKEKIL